MSGKKKNALKIWIGIGVVVIIAGLVTANLLVKRKPKGTQVDVAEAKVDSLVQTVTASGKIQPKIDVNISANVSGRILFLGAEEGENVQSGQLLVRIEDETYQAVLEQTKFMLRSSQANLDEAKSNLKRLSNLHSQKLASDVELEAQQAVVKRFEADVDRIKANIQQAEDDLAKTRIYAPISGKVTRLSKEVGEMAIGATFSEDVIMVVSKLDKMEVNVEVTENDVVLLDIGDPVKIEVFAIPDTFYHGEITEIAHSGIVRGLGTAEEVTNFEVKVAVKDRVEQLRPGMSATVEIITDLRDKTITLPQEAVAVRSMEDEKKKENSARSSKGKGKKKDKDKNDEKRKLGDRKEELVEVVYVVKNDTAWVKEVKLGIHSDTHFEILEGISEGDLIVTGPFRMISRELHSGQLVKYDKPKSDDKGKSEKSNEADTSQQVTENTQ